MKKSLMLFTGIATAAVMMLSCNPTDSTEIPQEGKHNTSLVGTYSLEGVKLVVEVKPGVDSLRYTVDKATVTIPDFAYQTVTDTIAFINGFIAAQMNEIDFKINLKEDGLFSYATKRYEMVTDEVNEYYYTFPDDAVTSAEAEGIDFPYVKEDFTWFSTSTALYLAIERTKTDVLINKLINPEEPVEDPVVNLPARVKSQVDKIIKVAAEETLDIKDFEKYIAAILYVSDNVYALPVKYTLKGDVLTLIPIDKQFVSTVVATVDALAQEYLKSMDVSTPDAAGQKAEMEFIYSSIKSIADQVLRDVTKMQIEITFAKDKEVQAI